MRIVSVVGQFQAWTPTCAIATLLLSSTTPASSRTDEMKIPSPWLVDAVMLFPTRENGVGLECDELRLLCTLYQIPISSTSIMLYDIVAGDPGL
jgi:hypothetical protein